MPTDKRKLRESDAAITLFVNEFKDCTEREKDKILAELGARFAQCRSRHRKKQRKEKYKRDWTVSWGATTRIPWFEREKLKKKARATARRPKPILRRHNAIVPQVFEDSQEADVEDNVELVIASDTEPTTLCSNMETMKII